MSNLTPSQPTKSLMQSEDNTTIPDYEPYEDLERAAKFYRKINREDSKCLTPTQEGEISDLVEKIGRSDLAQTRTKEMEVFVQYEWSNSQSLIIKALVGVASALIFTALPQVFTLRLDLKLAKPAALIGGAAIGILAGEQVARLKTRRKLHNISQENLEYLQEQQQQYPDKPFEQEYYQVQIDLLRTVERKHLNKLSLTEIISHSAFASVEAAAAAYLVFTAASNPLFALIAAGASLALILTVADAESEHIKLPKEARELIERYRSSLTKLTSISDEMIQNTNRTHYLVKYLIEGDPKGQIKNLGMAEAAFDVYCWEQEKWLMGQKMLAARRQCQDEYDTRKRELDELVSPQLEDRERRGLSPEQIRRQQDELDREHFEHIQQRKEALEAEKFQKLANIEEDFSLQIGEYEEKSKQAKQQLEAAYKEWRRENGLPEIEPSIATVDLPSEESKESEGSPKRFNIFDNLRFPRLL